MKEESVPYAYIKLLLLLWPKAILKDKPYTDF